METTNEAAITLHTSEINAELIFLLEKEYTVVISEENNEIELELFKNCPTVQQTSLF